LKTQTAINLELKKNQFFYNKKQFTFDKNIAKSNIDKQQNILLSFGYDRRIEFYALRKINLR
jgi:ribulose bisphosphate carboxylase small subunit